MQKLRLVGALFITALLLASCGRNNPMVNIVDAPTDARQSANLEMITEAITRAGGNRGWTMKVLRPGLIRGDLDVHGKHQVQVDIIYNHDDFSITYVHSTNMNYNVRDGVPYIHPKFNRWIRILKEDIQDQIAQVR